jgi:hypothetical protein
MKFFYKSKLNHRFISICVVLVSAPAMAQVVNQAVQTSAITFTTQTVETGPILDVVPYVLSDGYTITLH